MNPEVVHHFFAWSPWVFVALGFGIVYYATRHEHADVVPIGKTYACAACGKRGKHEHMVPVSAAGSLVWYCHRCSHAVEARVQI